jgi:hypothetical protein
MLVNIVNVPTPHGWRSIELREGDITSPDPNTLPDVLVVSSFKGQYEPIPNTVIGCLKSRLGLSVKKLAEEPEYQIGSRDAWMTHRLDPHIPFQRLVCVEMLDFFGPKVDSEHALKRAVRSLFGLLAVAEINEVPIQRIAMPMLGTGNQRLGIDVVMPWIIETVSKLLGNLSTVQAVQIYVLRDGAAAAQKLNALLDRDQSVSVGVSEDSQRMVGRVCAKLDSFVERAIIPESHASALELLLLLKRDAGSFVTLAALARRLVEAIVQNIARERGVKPDAELIKKIDALTSHGVSPWMVSYMHLLRVFGNEAVHAKPQESRHPKTINGGDLAVLLLCLDRILEWELSLR